MLKKLGVAILMAVLGGVIIWNGYAAWNDDPLRGYQSIAGTILNHRVGINFERGEKNLSAMVVETHVRAADGTEPTLREYFSDPDGAWEFALGHAVGSGATLFRSADGETHTWGSVHRSGSVIAMIIGVLILAAAVLVTLRKTPRWVADAGAALFCLFFLLGGSVAAWGIWPVAYTHVRAKNWTAVPYELLDEHASRSGKSSKKAAISYTFDGKTYEAVLESDVPEFQENPPDSRVCHVNPSKPWQVVRSWGWRPGLSFALFPVPFLIIGAGGLAMILVPALRRIAESQSPKEGQAELSNPWSKVALSGVALVFIGSFIGIPVGACGELWMADQPMKWFLTIFLIPFLLIVARTARIFLKELRSALWR